MEGAVNFKPSEFRVGTGEFGCRDYCWGARYGFEGDESLVHIHTRVFRAFTLQAIRASERSTPPYPTSHQLVVQWDLGAQDSL